LTPPDPGRTTPCPEQRTSCPRGEWMTGSRTPACPHYGLDSGEHATAHNVLNIPSSRLDQHGAHDAALKAVRPRLRLRALRLDRDAAHAPVYEPPEPPEKRASTTPSRDLTGPAPSWMTRKEVTPRRGPAMRPYSRLDVVAVRGRVGSRIYRQHADGPLGRLQLTGCLNEDRIRFRSSSRTALARTCWRPSCE